MSSNQIPGSVPNQPISSTHLPPAGIDWKAIVAPSLTQETSRADFENNLERFQNTYPVHSFSGKMAQAVKQGLNLSYEPGLPLTVMSRAIISASARMFPSKDGS